MSPERITLSSDGNGSMPRFDAEGKLTGMGIGPIELLVEGLRGLGARVERVD